MGVPKNISNWQSSWIGRKLSRKISMASTVTINANIYLHLFFMLMAYQVGKPWWYLRNLSRIMAEKMEEPILHVGSWINCRIAIAVGKYYPRICRARFRSILQDRDPYWGPESGQHIKLHTSLALRSNPITPPHHPCYSPHPHPIFAHRAHVTTWGSKSQDKQA